MLAFALVSYEPDFLVELIDEGELVPSIQLLWVARQDGVGQGSAYSKEMWEPGRGPGGWMV